MPHYYNPKILQRTIDYTECYSVQASKFFVLATAIHPVQILSAWIEVNEPFLGSPNDYKALKVCLGRSALTHPNEFLADSPLVGTGKRITKGSEMASTFPVLDTLGSIRCEVRDGGGSLGGGDLPLDHLVQGSFTIYLLYTNGE